MQTPIFDCLEGYDSKHRHFRGIFEDVFQCSPIHEFPIQPIVGESEQDFYLRLLEHQIDLIIDTPTRDDKQKDGFVIRRTAIETGVNCLTALDTANALITSLETMKDGVSEVIDIARI